ncbi:hypothetical protein G4B88_010697 [Cannabis sativa]|uniref:Reverse transcriptase zinc-binding domain-containing protein n=1 Tax=Cannabis sativa TaxID=3483 RepID=A0A7J6E233_CANSA|nr:hypothetical protein G4B88_010697 [Cannabis sativa]
MLVEGIKVDFYGAIWDKLVVPKHRFIFWQIVNSQLLTQDYLHAIPSHLCPVCEAKMETHDHLFFNCNFYLQVSAAVKTWLGDFHWPSLTTELLNSCCNMKQLLELGDKENSST